MKTIRSLALLSLAVPLGLCPAQEANPFLNQEQEQQAPPGPSGDSFLTLTEHVLVPADILDSWLAGRPVKEDASELRAAVQGWVHEGRATLDQSALSAGTAGCDYSNASTIEPIYPTEYMPSTSPEDWMVSTAFETRYVGYGSNGDAVLKKGGLVIRAKNDVIKMLPHPAPNKLMEETRQPGDVFKPEFWTAYAGQSPSTEIENADGYITPEAEAAEKKRKTPPSYPVGKTFLAFRGAEDRTEPVPDKSREDKPDTAPLPANHLVRLIFVRSEGTGSTEESTDPLPTDYHFSGKLLSVDHRTLSDWLQGRDLATASRELGDAIEKWDEAGKVTTLRTTSGSGRNGTLTELSDTNEVIYATEFVPGKRRPVGDGKSTQLEFALACSFETRNVGSTLMAGIETDQGGPLLRVSFERILHGGFSVHHRVLRDGEWVPDITMPLFSGNRWLTSLRLKRGEWMLVGSGSAFGEGGQFDPTRTVLAFVKVE